MNRTLLTPQDIVGLPEVIEEYLDEGTATCVAFNRRGTMIAVGTEEGTLILYNSDTRGVTMTLEAHSGAAVRAVSWSANGQYIASAGTDGRVVLHNLKAPQQQVAVDTGRAINHLQLSPKEPFTAVASVASGPPLLLEFSSCSLTPLPCVVHGANGLEVGSSQAMAHLSRDASLVYVAGPKGLITVLEANSRKVLDVYRIQGAPKVTAAWLQLNQKGNHLLASCPDRTLRLFKVLPLAGSQCQPLSKEEVEQRLRSSPAVLPGNKGGSLLYGAQGLLASPGSVNAVFQNPTERMDWVDACFSYDDEHVLGAAKTEGHALYIWDRSFARMERILQGPKEGVVAVAWHPYSNLVASVSSSSGRVYLWAQQLDERWSTFAPDFEELTINREYVEREDEFDVNERPDEEEVPQDTVPEEEFVDVVAKDPTAALWSDEEEDELLVLPLHLEPLEEKPVEEQQQEQQQEQQAAALFKRGGKRKAESLPGGSRGR